MPLHEEDDADEGLSHEDSPEPARKRLRSSVHDSTAGYARGSAAQDSKAPRNGKAVGNGRAALPDRTFEEMPQVSESDEAEEVEASDEEAPQRQQAKPVRGGMRADAGIVNGQAGSLRARLGSSAPQGKSLAQRVISSGLRSDQGTRDAMNKGGKGSRGLFSAALTGLQR